MITPKNFFLGSGYADLMIGRPSIVMMIGRPFIVIPYLVLLCEQNFFSDISLTL